MCAYAKLTHDRSVHLPCPTRDVASTIQQVIQVDKELRPHDVHKKLEIEEDGHGAVTLHVYVWTVLTP